MLTFYGKAYSEKEIEFFRNMVSECLENIFDKCIEQKCEQCSVSHVCDDFCSLHEYLAKYALNREKHN